MNWSFTKRHRMYRTVVLVPKTSVRGILPKNQDGDIGTRTTKRNNGEPEEWTMYPFLVLVLVYPILFLIDPQDSEDLDDIFTRCLTHRILLCLHKRVSILPSLVFSSPTVPVRGRFGRPPPSMGRRRSKSPGSVRNRILA